jgi:plastocyanin
MRFQTSLSLGLVLVTLPLIGFGCTKAPEQAAQPSTEQPATSTAPSTNTATTSTTAPVKPKTTTTTTKPKTTTTQPTAKNIVVTITGMKFSPQFIAASAGDTITWVNKDIVPHTTKSDAALLWDSGTIRPGSNYKRVFNAPGSYTYSCAIHPTMHGTVIIR